LTDELSSRDRRAAARQTRILEAAARVFAEKGYRHATIRDVAQAADVADGTIYNYFENKEALLYALIDQLSVAEQSPLLKAGGDLPAVVLDRMHHLRTQYDLFSAVLPEILGTPELRAQYFERFVVPVAAALQQDLGVEETLSARILLAAVLGFQVLLILDDPVTRDAWDQPETLARVWSQFVAGMGKNP
jgi:AcrR family transcriptional regulator